jgi:hypothetical protein
MVVLREEGDSDVSGLGMKHPVYDGRGKRFGLLAEWLVPAPLEDPQRGAGNRSNEILPEEMGHNVVEAAMGD